MLIFNWLLEAEADKISNGEDAEDEIPDILITIAAKLLQLLHNIDSLKLPDIIKSALKELKKYGTNENDNENINRSEMSSSEGSSSS